MIFLRSARPAGRRAGNSTCEDVMGKGDNKRGNKEVKKPKQEKPKVLATANAGTAKPVSLGAKKSK